MVNSIRKFGRWGKRSYLRTRLALSGSAGKKYHNERLNWREFWHGRIRLNSYPLFIQLGTNWSCNLRCNFCRREIEPYKSQVRAIPSSEREISPAVLEAMKEILPYAISMNLTPLGEPLMYSGLDDILSIHGKLNCRNLALTTNGQLLSEEMSKKLVRAGTRELFISVDTHDPDRYRKMRIGGELEQLIRGVDNVRRWKEQWNREYPEITFCSTFMRSNIEDLPGLIELASRHGVSKIRVQLMEPETPDLEPEMLWHYVPLTARVIRESLEISKKAGVPLDLTLALKNLLSSANGDNSENSPLQKEQNMRGKALVEKCRFPWNSIMVDTDGEVRPCCWAGIRFGNLNTQSFDEIWNGRAAIGMRKQFLKNVIPQGCKNKHCRVDL